MDSTLSLVVLSILTVLASAQNSSGLIGNACFGANIACDFYSLQCPQGEIIHLNNLIAGGKTNQTCRSEQHCSGGLDCCSYNQGDLTSPFNQENTYHTYRNCSGRQSCTAIQAPLQRLDASTKIPMCGSNPGIYTSSAEVWFDGSTETFDPTKASRECRCTVKNNQIGRGLELYMYLLDVRVESHYVGNVSSAACSSAQFSSEMVVLRCVNTTRHWETNFKYYNSNSSTHQYSKVLQSGQTTDLGLSSLYENGQRDAPAMVWIKIALDETSQVSAVVVAVPIACVLVVMLAVSTACFFKERRKRMEAENENTNTSVRDRSVKSLQEFPSERVYDTIVETNNPEGNYNMETRNITWNLANVYTESAPVAPVQQTDTDDEISGQNCAAGHDYETLQHSPYQNTETSGEQCSVYNQLTF
ncbi:hypothetical protein MAR_018220 [Mya arenaria]|uniref:Uncharacterized protein n=1 Tax=Mya arenaria TaxID=6604 RepID=A0ABY7EHB6_MYAAR|nr:hypothetical protein MAR_018220 [Mya arenaria]